ncbi:hypothetical protein [Microbacterium sediminis]|uniref:Uncharacterized protein n=1 Tax=Microbacterium sediminis TaxID=904291 RepID=A0A1B9NDT7_9MICO|nr:hypothetical protein [Microbacterium sediminis]OCG74769.1 hypothetical protein A7J15_04410 [Microbacterium sediminis]QBR75071.1 hypothetical protein E3O41_12145 [Microbacterium sediminis]
MQRTESVGAWARTARFDEPIDLGLVEQQILARPLPEARGRSREGMPVAQFVAGVFFMLVPAVAPLLAFGLLWGASRETDSDVADALLIGAGVASPAGVAFPLTALMLWAQKRRRSVFVTTVAVVAPVVSIAATALLWTPGLPVTTAVFVGNLASAVLSVILCALVFLASRPETEEAVEREAEEASREEALRLKERTIALHVLHDRGLIDVATYERAIDMPLGSWGELSRKRG